MATASTARRPNRSRSPSAGPYRSVDGADAAASWTHPATAMDEELIAANDRAHQMNNRSNRSRVGPQPNGYSAATPRLNGADAHRPSNSDVENVKVAADGQLYQNSVGRRDMRRTGSSVRGQALGEDDSKWIHRDKLAQIESRELEEAGIRVSRTDRPSRPRSRASSRSNSRHRRPGEGAAEGKEQHHEEVPELQAEYSERRRPRTRSPPTIEQDLYHGSGGGGGSTTFDFELRTPGEVAAEQEAPAQQTARSQSLRTSSSRIPVAKTSPVPVPHTLIERDSPLARSRNNSGAWSAGAFPDDGFGFPRTRSRSQSAGSQNLLDSVDAASQPSQRQGGTTPPSSPGKARSPTKAVPGANGRKTSHGRVPSGTRHASAGGGGGAGPRDASARRPGTSSGRPSTSHAPPEGEPPWLATMYKPDPRLPPEQQLLPTHAKRLAQEQWEKDGKTGTAYDTHFRLLNDEDLSRPDKASAPPVADRPSSGQWPLVNTRVERAERSPRRPSPALSPAPAPAAHGDYSTVPQRSPQRPPQTISLMPPVPAAPPARRRSRDRHSQQAMPMTKAEEQPEPRSKAKTKSAGCCSVM